MCINFFSVKDFSGTTSLGILKFGTHFEYGFLYCVRGNQHPHAYLSSYGSQSLHIHLKRPGVVLCKRKPRCWNSFCRLFSISHSICMHREICVKDFLGTTAPRILKFGTNIRYDLFYCVRDTRTWNICKEGYIPHGKLQTFTCGGLRSIGTLCPQAYTSWKFFLCGRP